MKISIATKDDARQVSGALDTYDLGPLDVLFIENVGNLVCPTSYDLGEDFKVALLSVTEGEDKPFKYPSIFAKAAVTVVTKADLLPSVSFKLDDAREQVAALRPGGARPPVPEGRPDVNRSARWRRP